MVIVVDLALLIPMVVFALVWQGVLVVISSIVAWVMPWFVLRHLIPGSHRSHQSHHHLHQHSIAGLLPSFGFLALVLILENRQSLQIHHRHPQSHRPLGFNFYHLASQVPS